MVRSLNRPFDACRTTACMLGALSILALCSHAQAQQPAASSAPAAGAPAAAPAAATPADIPQIVKPPIMAPEDYQELREVGGEPIKEDKKARGPVQNMLRNGKFENADEEAIFTSYYRFRIAELTWYENLQSLPIMRGKLKKNDLSTAGKIPGSPVHERLNTMLLKAASAIAGDEAYHPAVRVNMMLLIGYLDQVEPDVLGKGAVPLAAAMPELLKALEDSKQLDAVRVSALEGILRHAEYGMPAPNQKLVVDAMQKLISTKAPGDMSPAGFAWARRRAVEVLQLLAKTSPQGNRPELVGPLKNIVADADASLITRCDAARTIGTMEKQVFVADQVKSIADALGRLAVSATKGNVSGEWLTYCLTCIKIGLTGENDPNRGLLAAANNAQAKTYVKGLNSHLDELLKTSSNIKAAPGVYQQEISDKAQKLEEWLNEQSQAGDKVAAGRP